MKYSRQELKMSTLRKSYTALEKAICCTLELTLILTFLLASWADCSKIETIGGVNLSFLNQIRPGFLPCRLQAVGTKRVNVINQWSDEPNAYNNYVIQTSTLLRKRPN